MQFDRRMSAAETLMWRLDRDPAMSSTFANVTLLDRAIDVDRFRRRLDRASHLVARLRQRVHETPANLAPPVWVDVAEFDITDHVLEYDRPVRDTRGVLDVATEICNEPFDRRRPLWSFVVINGLDRGQSAVIEKLHHTVVDGEGGVKLSLQFVDFERDAPEPPPLSAAEIQAAAPPSPPPSSPLDPLRDLLGEGFRMSLNITEKTAEFLLDPRRIPKAGSRAITATRAIAEQLTDVDKARSPLWTTRSLERRFETLRCPLEPVKRAAKSWGGTLNTAFLTAATDAAGAYHRALGAPTDALRASMAISTRTNESGANAFSLARFVVPTGEMEIAARFAAVLAVTTQARAASNKANLELLAKVATRLPTPLVQRLARQQAQTVDFATSNVKAAPFALYIAGARILENYGMGPLAGVAFNLTLLSYAGSLDMGVNIDRAAVSEPGLLRDCLEASFAALVEEGA